MNDRPSPDALLRVAARQGRGRLKIFLGAAPGVGKTFEMLREGAAALRAGRDVVVALVETHGRAETAALVSPFELVPRRTVGHRGHSLGEMDLDAVLARAPALALVDEFAHSNAPGSRHPKRWQDVAELLDAGIDVWTTLNVQHVESLNDVVAGFTHVRVRETVPDSVFDGAEIELVDLPPDELVERMKGGKIYGEIEARRALANFFTRPNLSALREMALRHAALSVDRAMLDDLDASALPGTYAGGERVLVAVSELTGADALVRAGKRLADALKAPWSAVFIETPRAAGFAASDRQRVADALRLASGLGATIATVPAETVTRGLSDQLTATRATQLVIGKSARSRWFEWRHGSVVAAMMRGRGDLAVHVLPAGAVARPLEPIAAPARAEDWGRLPAYGAAVALVAAMTGLATLLQPVIGFGAIDLLYLLPVTLVSGRFGLRPGVVAGVLAALAYNFFFLPPVHTLLVADPQGVLTLGVMVGIAILIAELAGRLRTRATIGARGAAENAAVAAFGQALARAADWSETARVVCAELARLLDVSVVLLAPEAGQLVARAAAPPREEPLGAVDRAAAEWCWSRAEPAGAGTGTLAAADWQFHPLATTLGTLAVVGLGRADARDPVAADRMVLLQTLLGQAALAHERLRLQDELRHVELVDERDRLRTALLSSIGHDLRTPLTGVTGAIEAIAAEHPDATALPLARAEAVRLKRFLDNLLAMVRIDTGAVSPRLELVDPTDAVAAAIDDLRGALDGRDVIVRVPAELPFVRADPVMLHHILLNLLVNAGQHGGAAGTIEVDGDAIGGRVRLAIRDHGAGLPDAADPLASFGAGTGSDRSGGSGLGLAIVRAFAGAMALDVSAGNAPDGGAVFELRFRPA